MGTSRLPSTRRESFKDMGDTYVRESLPNLCQNPGALRKFCVIASSHFSTSLHKLTANDGNDNTKQYSNLSRGWREKGKCFLCGNKHKRGQSFSTWKITARERTKAITKGKLNFLRKMVYKGHERMVSSPRSQQRRLVAPVLIWPINALHSRYSTPPIWALSCWILESTWKVAFSLLDGGKPYRKKGSIFNGIPMLLNTLPAPTTSSYNLFLFELTFWLVLVQVCMDRPIYSPEHLINRPGPFTREPPKPADLANRSGQIHNFQLKDKKAISKHVQIGESASRSRWRGPALALLPLRLCWRASLCLHFTWPWSWS